MKPPNEIQEVQLHYVRPTVTSMPFIRDTNDAVSILRSFIDPSRIDLKEFFWVILLTHAHQVLGVSEVAIGDTNEVIINKKEIFQLALLSHASCVILSHNHPSGNVNPSKADIDLTSDIAAFGALVNIKILDHIILSSEDYFSFADNQVL